MKPSSIHDETIDRVTEKKGWVKDYTLKELKELTVLKNKFPEYSAAKIPTLEEVLDAVKASGIQVNIELKTGIYWYPEIEQKVADLVKASGMEDKVIYSSFNHYSIQQMKKIVPEAETAVSMLLTVAPTLGISRKMSAPINSSALATTTPPRVSTSAPSVRMPLIV